ncbi:SAVED domain-containing protein, partial [Vibrio breoganii]
PIREPKTWSWQPTPDEFEFIVEPSNTAHGLPVLVLSLSAHINHTRIYSELGDKVDIWEVKTPVQYQHNDFIRSPEQLSQFRKTMRQVLERISAQYGLDAQLSIFPAMPASCAVELGRVRMPKASMS